MRTPALLITTISVLALLLGAFELAVTRTASILFFFDIAYLLLSLCLFGLGIGALAWKRDKGLVWLVALFLISLIAAYLLLPRYEVPWQLGLFVIPFALFGAASAVIWRRLEGVRTRRLLYLAELVAMVVGIVWIGPLLTKTLEIDVFGDIGVLTHLKDTAGREGIASHSYTTGTYARTDYLQTQNPAVRYLFTDGMFVTRSVQWDGQSSSFENPGIEQLATLKRFAFRTANSKKVALLGAGAGIDFAVALQEGAIRIDAIEINPNIIEYALKFDAWAGGVMTHPATNVHIAEARRFIQNSDQQWNHISLMLMQTSPASIRGRQHADARVLTKEAVDTYLAHLEINGVLAVIQNTEVLADATAAVTGHVPNLHFQLEATEGNPFAYLTIVRNEPFTKQEIDDLRFLATEFGVRPRTPQPASHVATDDRPFFFEANGQFGLQAILGTLFSLLLIMFILLFNRNKVAFRSASTCASLTGACMMATQVFAIYFCQSAIGEPALALAVALSATLFGAGVGVFVFGSMASKHWVASGVFAALGVLLLMLFAPNVVDVANQQSVSVAAWTTGSWLFFCCLPLGLPFFSTINQSWPTHQENTIIGFDGLGGVIGASSATAVAINLGFSALALSVTIGFVLFSLVAVWSRFAIRFRT